MSLRRFACTLGLHDWKPWFDTQYRASLYRWQRQCQRCGRYQFDNRRSS